MTRSIVKPTPKMQELREQHVAKMAANKVASAVPDQGSTPVLEGTPKPTPTTAPAQGSATKDQAKAPAWNFLETKEGADLIESIHTSFESIQTALSGTDRKDYTDEYKKTLPNLFDGKLNEVQFKAFCSDISIEISHASDIEAIEARAKTDPSVYAQVMAKALDGNNPGEYFKAVLTCNSYVEDDACASGFHEQSDWSYAEIAGTTYYCCQAD